MKCRYPFEKPTQSGYFISLFMEKGVFISGCVSDSSGILFFFS